MMADFYLCSFGDREQDTCYISSITSTFMNFWDRQQRHGFWRLWQLQYSTFYYWFVKIIISSCRIIAIWIVPLISILSQMNAYKNVNSDIIALSLATLFKITVWGLLGAEILWVESAHWYLCSQSFLIRLCWFSVRLNLFDAVVHLMVRIFKFQMIHFWSIGYTWKKSLEDGRKWCKYSIYSRQIGGRNNDKAPWMAANWAVSIHWPALFANTQEAVGLNKCHLSCVCRSVHFNY